MERIVRTLGPPVDSWRPIGTFNMARRMKKNKMAAARIRARYLREQIELCRQAGDPIALVWAGWMETEMNTLLVEGQHEIKEQPHNPNIISDGDVVAARNYPVEGLVEWTRGKAICWAHEDRSPSLFFANRINRIRCPVCDKNFNAVDVLMGLNGYSFVEAVKALR